MTLQSGEADTLDPDQLHLLPDHTITAELESRGVDCNEMDVWDQRLELRSRIIAEIADSFEQRRAAQLRAEATLSEVLLDAGCRV